MIRHQTIEALKGGILGPWSFPHRCPSFPLENSGTKLYAKHEKAGDRVENGSEAETIRRNRDAPRSACFFRICLSAYTLRLRVNQWMQDRSHPRRAGGQRTREDLREMLSGPAR